MCQHCAPLLAGSEHPKLCREQPRTPRLSPHPASSAPRGSPQPPPPHAAGGGTESPEGPRWFGRVAGRGLSRGKVAVTCVRPSEAINSPGRSPRPLGHRGEDGAGLAGGIGGVKGPGGLFETPVQVGLGEGDGVEEGAVGSSFWGRWAGDGLRAPRRGGQRVVCDALEPLHACLPRRVRGWGGQSLSHPPVSPSSPPSSGAGGPRQHPDRPPPPCQPPPGDSCPFPRPHGEPGAAPALRTPGLSPCCPPAPGRPPQSRLSPLGRPSLGFRLLCN